MDSWSKVLRAFYGAESSELFPEHVESPGGIVAPECIENRPGLMPETIDKDAYREFMRGL